MLRWNECGDARVCKSVAANPLAAYTARGRASDRLVDDFNRIQDGSWKDIFQISYIPGLWRPVLRISTGMITSRLRNLPSPGWSSPFWNSAEHIPKSLICNTTIFR